MVNWGLVWMAFPVHTFPSLLGSGLMVRPGCAGGCCVVLDMGASGQQGPGHTTRANSAVTEDLWGDGLCEVKVKRGAR